MHAGDLRRDSVLMCNACCPRMIVLLVQDSKAEGPARVTSSHPTAGNAPPLAGVPSSDTALSPCTLQRSPRMPPWMCRDPPCHLHGMHAPISVLPCLQVCMAGHSCSYLHSLKCNTTEKSPASPCWSHLLANAQLVEQQPGPRGMAAFTGLQHNKASSITAPHQELEGWLHAVHM